jgi:hypothetical protein
MVKKARVVVALLVLCTLATSLYAQRGFRRGMSVPAPGQSAAGEPAEWTFARLAYDSAGMRGGSWWVDYPGAEYHFSEAVDRLTLVNPHASGHVISPDDDAIFDYPWLYAVEPWSWSFSADQATRLREYFLRGGFMMVDDFHGEQEWTLFMTGLRKIFPDRAVEDIPAEDAINLTPYPISERLQVPGPNYMFSGMTYERNDGATPHWRGVRDENGRWVVVISHNIDYGEGWEQANTPEYPEPFTRQAYEIGINYLIYSLTH